MSNKLSPRQINEILSAYADGVTQRELAKKYGVTQASISYQLRRNQRRLDKIVNKPTNGTEVGNATFTTLGTINLTFANADEMRGFMKAVAGGYAGL